MSEHQRDAENRTDRIRDPSAGDVGRRAVDGLVESAAHTGGGGVVAERRRWKYAQRSGQHRRLVGEDVAEHVLRHYYIEAARIAQASTNRWSSATSGNSSRNTRVTVERQRREVSRTFALSTDVSLRLRVR